jgi:hypothetical protein
MKWRGALLILLVCVSASCFAQDAVGPAREAEDAKFVISKRTWSPIFATISLDEGMLGRPVKQEDLQGVNERFYSVYAEYLDEPELLLQEIIYRTAVGKKIGESMVRALFGLQPFTLKYGDFSRREQGEWESFVQENYVQFKQLENKMKGFPEFVRSRLTPKEAPRQ